MTKAEGALRSLPLPGFPLCIPISIQRGRFHVLDHP